MKRFFNVMFATIVAMISFISCGNLSASNVNREEFVEDSIVVEDEVIAVTVPTPILNYEVIARYSKLFNVKKDEFNNITWVIPKDAPKYRNENGVYCYFATNEDSTATPIFRFVYRYSAENWLFIQYMIFNIDGENITITPDMKTDCGYGGTIWEWCDELVKNNNINGINKDFIKKIANAKSVKVKMVGSKYSEIRTLSAAQIKSIKNTYEYYLALDGGGRMLN